MDESTPRLSRTAKAIPRRAASVAGPLAVIATAAIMGMAVVFILGSPFRGQPGTGMLPASPATPGPSASPSPTLIGSASPSPTTLNGSASPSPTESESPKPSPTSQATPSPPRPTPIVHVVARGEYLILIAERYGVTVAELVELNELDDPGVIFIGQRLLIPGPQQ